MYPISGNISSKKYDLCTSNSVFPWSRHLWRGSHSKNKVRCHHSVKDHLVKFKKWVKRSSYWQSEFKRNQFHDLEVTPPPISLTKSKKTTPPQKKPPRDSIFISYCDICICFYVLLYEEFRLVKVCYFPFSPQRKNGHQSSKSNSKAGEVSWGNLEQPHVILYVIRVNKAEAGHPRGQHTLQTSDYGVPVDLAEHC